MNLMVYKTENASLLLLRRQFDNSSGGTTDCRKTEPSDDLDIAKPTVPHQLRDLRWKRLLHVRQHLNKKYTLLIDKAKLLCVIFL